jgi:CSLREA domain-containing protein
MKINRFNFSFLLMFIFSLVALTIPIQAVQAQTTFTVTNADDPGNGICDNLCTLREAIDAANGTLGTDIIEFNIAGGGAQTISPVSALPTITDPVMIDATTQPGFAGSPLIELDGSIAGAVNGLTLTAGGSTIRGFVINRFSGQGIQITGINATGNLVEGNFIGTDITGTQDLGNTGIGIDIAGGAGGNIIGGTNTAARNIISGNDSFGVFILDPSATSNLVQGNFIGTDVTGTQSLGNSSVGVGLEFTSGQIIGGILPGEGNLISGNGGNGIFLNDTANGNFVEGNLIGTDVTGALSLGNGGDGVNISGSINNTIGGTVTGAGNTIAFNSGNGVNVFFGTGNTIWGNLIFSNTNLGIDLGNNGVTANDTGDPDTGANNLQNFPDLTSAVSANGSTTIQGTLNSTANTNFRIEFFTNDSCDASGNGEGQTLLGAVDPITTDVSGNVSINVNLLVALSGTKFITATATDSSNNTSEFSSCIQAAILVENCSNGIDDDQDNLIDCADPDCANNNACLIIEGASCDLGSGTNSPVSSVTVFLSLLLMVGMKMRRRSYSSK